MKNRRETSSQMEHNIHGQQQFVYKVIKILQEEKDKIGLNNIPKKEWLVYYARLCCDPKGTEGGMEELDVFDKLVDPITEKEL